MENLLAGMLRIHSFSAHYTALYTENSMKSIFTINPIIAENMERSISEAHTPVIDLKVSEELDHAVSLRFVSLPALRSVTFQANNTTRSIPASTALDQVLH